MENGIIGSPKSSSVIITTLELPTQWDMIKCLLIVQVFIGVTEDNCLSIEEIELSDIQNLQIVGQEIIETEPREITKFFDTMESLGKDYKEEMGSYVKDQILSKDITSIFQDLSNVLEKIYTKK